MINIKKLLLSILGTLYVVVPVIYLISSAEIKTLILLIILSVIHGISIFAFNKVLDLRNFNGNKTATKLIANFILTSVFLGLYKTWCITVKNFIAYENIYMIKSIVFISTILLIIINVFLLPKLYSLLVTKSTKQELIISILNTFIILSYTDAFISYIINQSNVRFCG